MKVSYREALEILHKHGKTLKATDFHPYSYVILHHEEGTTLIYASAFAIDWMNWVFVYTEHHGEMAYDKSDLSSWMNLHRVSEQHLEGTGYKDKCTECGNEFPVEDLRYDAEETICFICQCKED